MSANISPLSPQAAPEQSVVLFEAIRKKVGVLPALYATIGASARSLSHLLAWDGDLAQGSLSKRDVELINLHVSELNGCGYCISAHSGVAKRVGLSPAAIEAARDGHGENEREHALLAFVRRVVRTGGARSTADLQRLRAAGFSDEQVIDILAVVALKTFTNAVALVAKTEIDLPRAPRLPVE